VQDGKFDGNNVDYINEIPKRMPDYCKLSTGDILLSLTGNVGRVCVVTGDDYLLNQRVAKLNSQYPHFTYCLFRTETIFNTLNAIAYGTAQLNLSPIKAALLKVLVPPTSLREHFDKQVAPIFSQINTLQLQSANLTRQRDLLLPRLMSGQLTPLTNQ
jgi:type I restriction enzyme S subunit